MGNRMVRRVFAVLSTLLLASVVGGGCGDLKRLYSACSKASDCPSPWVCCNKPNLPNGDPLPYCEEYDGCLEYMPFLVEGNPCNRNRGNTPAETCAQGLECCSSTLSCGQQGKCPPNNDSDAPSSLTDCVADLDCPEGEICCNIDYNDRNGICATVVACRTGTFSSGSQNCPTGLVLCGTSCSDTTSDRNNCGGCNQACLGGTICVGSTCVASMQCTLPMADCDIDGSNGCEVNTATDPQNCGVCGYVCPASISNDSLTGCENSVCVYQCNEGFSDCDNSRATGCERPSATCN